MLLAALTLQTIQLRGDPAAAIIDGVALPPSSSTAAVGALLSIDPAGPVVLPDGTEVLPWALCSAVLIDASWALTDAGCVTADDSMLRFAAGELSFDDLLYSRRYEEDGERRPDLHLYAAFGDADVRLDIDVLLAHYAVDGPDIPNYPGSFVRTGVPRINPDLRPVSFAEGEINDFIGSLALVPLGAPARVEPLAFSSDPNWPSRFAPAILSGFGVTANPGQRLPFDGGLRRADVTVLRSAMTAAQPGDPTGFCESTQYVIGETLCARVIGAPGGSGCFGDVGGAVAAYRDFRSVLVSLIGGLFAFPTTLCGEAGQLDRTTSIAPAAEWITSVTGVDGVDGPDCATTGAGTGHAPPVGVFFVPCWVPEGPHPFGDVNAKPDPYFADVPIGFLFANGITTGVSPTSYVPDAPVTRGDLATLLYRFVEAEPAELPSHPFVDVIRDYHNDPISFIYVAGVTTGSPAGSTTFRPDDAVTRAEMVTFLWRLIGTPDVPIQARFVDVVTKGDGYFAAGAIAWAAESGITTGSPAGSRTFRPDDSVTRAEVATFLARLAERL